MFTKKNITFKLLVCVGMGFFFYSCTDLDQDVYSEVPEENFWQSAEEIQAGVAPAYQALTDLSRQTFTEGFNMTSDELIVPTRGGDWDDGGFHRRAWLHKWDPSSGFENGMWESLFKGVSRTNQILYNLEAVDFDAVGDVDPAVFEQTVAEVKSLRAYFYYWVLKIFGNAPLVTDFTISPNDVATSPKEELYQYIEEELLSNIDKLPENVDGSTYGKFTKWAAYGVLAKLYMNSQFFIGEERWSDAEAMTDSIIESGNYSLNPSFFDNFSPDNKESPENIFVIPFDKVNIVGFDMMWRTLHYDMNVMFDLPEQPVNGYCAPPEFYDLFDLSHTDRVVGDKTYRTYNDQRTGMWVVGQQYDEKYPYPPYKDVLVDAPDEMKLKDQGTGMDLKIEPHFSELSSPNDEQRLVGARSIKYFPEAGTSKYTTSNDYVLLRYADVLLMNAEAIVRGGGDLNKALDDVNQVRERAYSGDASHNWTMADLTLENLLDENGRELAWEGPRRMALIRAEVASGTPYYSGPRTPEKMQDGGDYTFYLPIPEQQRNTNSKLEQNPGY